MNKNRNPLLAGLFMIFSVVLILGVIVAIRGFATELSVTRTASFTLADNISGLRVGDDVRIGGLRVGSVRKIELQKAGDGSATILVRFSIPQSADLRKDARVGIETSVTGVSNLNIDHLGSGASATEADVFVGTPSSFTSILAAAKDLAPNLSGLVGDIRTQTVPRVNETIDKVKGHIDPAMEKYHGVADRGSEALVNIRDVFGDTRTDFRTTMSNVAAATGTLKEKLPGLIDNMDGFLTKGQQTLEGALAALEDVKTTAGNLRDISSTGKRLVVGNKSKIEGLINSLKTAGDNLKFATAEIRRSPWRLLYKPSGGEVANLNLYDSARQFAEGANDLNDAAGALRDALQNKELGEDEVKMLLEKLDKSFEKFNEVESQLWTQVKE